MNKQTVSVDHISFNVRNFSESARWYQEVFGFEKVEEGMEKDGPWGILRADDTMLCIYENPSLTDPRSGPEIEKLHHIYHFGMRVHDRAKWEATVKERNLRVHYGGPVRYPHSTSWYVKDPTGHMIEVAFWDGNQVSFTS